MTAMRLAQDQLPTGTQAGKKAQSQFSGNPPSQYGGSSPHYSSANAGNITARSDITLPPSSYSSRQSTPYSVETESYDTFVSPRSDTSSSTHSMSVQVTSVLNYHIHLDNNQ